jgi:hypothetical protein
MARRRPWCRQSSGDERDDDADGSAIGQDGHGHGHDDGDRLLLYVLATGAALIPHDEGAIDDYAPCADERRFLGRIYGAFWTALEAIEDARPGTLATVPWPPTPMSVYLRVIDGPQDAIERARRGVRYKPPYGVERAYGLAATAWWALARAVRDEASPDPATIPRSAPERRFRLVVARLADGRWGACLIAPAGRRAASLLTVPDATSAAPSIVSLPDRRRKMRRPPPLRFASADGRTYELREASLADMDPIAQTICAIYRARRFVPSHRCPTALCALLHAALLSVSSCAGGNEERDARARCPILLRSVAPDRYAARVDAHELATALAVQLADRAS